LTAGELLVGEGGQLTDVHVVENRRGMVVGARLGDRLLTWRADGTTYPLLTWSPPVVTELPRGTEQLALFEESDETTWSGAVVRSGTLRICPDVTEQAWIRAEGCDAVSAVARVARTRMSSEPTGPSYVVTTAHEVVGLDRFGARRVAVSIGAVDDLAAAASRTDRLRTEVVVRTGTDLRHLTL